jgi:hypothetical protein
MAHDHHERIAPKQEFRDPALNARVTQLLRIVTHPRGTVERAVNEYNDMVKNFDRMEEVYNSYNISKEELLKTIEAYKILLANSEDLC